MVATARSTTEERGRRKEKKKEEKEEVKNLPFFPLLFSYFWERVSLAPEPSPPLLRWLYIPLLVLLTHTTQRGTKKEEGKGRQGGTWKRGKKERGKKTREKTGGRLSRNGSFDFGFSPWHSLLRWGKGREDANGRLWPFLKRGLNCHGVL